MIKEGKIMKLTKALVVWLNKEFKNSNYTSIRELGRASEYITYTTWGEALSGSQDTISNKTIKDICRIFHVTEYELLKISERDLSDDGGAYFKQVEEYNAMSLWRWLKYDDLRSQLIKGLGYEGSLPIDYKADRADKADVHPDKVN